MKEKVERIEYQLMIILMLSVVVIFGNSLSINAQQLPDEAGLPDGNGAWVIEQKFKNSIGGAYLPGITYVIIQSNGVVFHRKFFASGQPATPWCQDKFTVEEMRGIRGAVAISKPAAWDASYGPFINALGPFRALIMTMRNSSGKIVEYKTTLWRFYDLPNDIAKITNAVDEAGALAFSNCAEPLPDNDKPIVEKIEKGATMYAVDSKGDLLWYNHSGFQTGEPTWANQATGKNVGQGWAGNVKVFKGDPNGKDGIVYTVSPEGWLSWYKHNGYASGSTDWETPKNVGIDFNGQHVFSGGNGVIYLIDKAGEIYWYKHRGYQTGEKNWLNNGVGKKLGTDWTDARHVFSGGDGIIYKIDSRGDLYWIKHLGFQDGTANWSEQKKVGSGWQNLRQVFSGGNGIINAVKNDGTLLWQKHDGFATGTVLWANNGTAKTIGNGWIFNFVF